VEIRSIRAAASGVVEAISGIKESLSSAILSSISTRRSAIGVTRGRGRIAFMAIMAWGKPLFRLARGSVSEDDDPEELELDFFSSVSSLDSALESGLVKPTGGGRFGSAGVDFPSSLTWVSEGVVLAGSSALAPGIVEFGLSGANLVSAAVLSALILLSKLYKYWFTA
jgi:hypothetical protein